MDRLTKTATILFTAAVLAMGTGCATIKSSKDTAEVVAEASRPGSGITRTKVKMRFVRPEGTAIPVVVAAK